MFHEEGFQFGGSYTEALVLNHLFLTINDIGEAISVYMTDITRVEPTVTQGARGLLGRFPIALHDLRPAYNDLSVFAGR